jgi:hypothetical protein
METLEILRRLEKLNFEGRGESFVESNFLTPLLEYLGYEQHRDYEVIRHGDDGSSFKLLYPPVEQGGRPVRNFNPDFIPTIRKKAFWIIEAKSPKDVPYPFAGEFLVQGLQYCLHPEIQARYLLVSNGRDSAVFVGFGALNLDQDLYAPILEFKATELVQKWNQIFDLLSAEKLRTKIEDDLKLMYDKLCLSSLDVRYPENLIRKLGSSRLQNASSILKHVGELEAEKHKERFDALAAQKATLTAAQAYAQMELPFGWMGCEGIIFVDRSLEEGASAEDIFKKLTDDFDKQSIFRKQQTFAGACALYKKASEPERSHMKEFIQKHKSGELSLLNQVECAWIRVVRKICIIWMFPKLTNTIQTSLQTAPEMIRCVLPPTGIQEVLNTEFFIHAQIFARIRDRSETELNSELTNALKIEQDLAGPLSQAEKESALYKDSVFSWFETYGSGGRHFAFKNILHNLGLNFDDYYKACRKGDPSTRAVAVNRTPVSALADASGITGLQPYDFDMYEITKEEFEAFRPQ